MIELKVLDTAQLREFLVEFLAKLVAELGRVPINLHVPSRLTAQRKSTDFRYQFGLPVSANRFSAKASLIWNRNSAEFRSNSPIW